MTTQQVPLKAVRSQVLSVTLAKQTCQIRVYTLTTGLYLDLYVNNVTIVTCVLCQDRTNLIRGAYIPFSGNLFFADTQGTSDPTYDGLGARYVLVYSS